MTQDTYRFAFEEATSELREIATQFDVLRVRKEQVEQVIEALRPLLSDAPVAVTESIATQQEAVEQPFLVQAVTEPIVQSAPDASPEPTAEPVFAEQSSDPFQRRIDNALRQGFGSTSKIMPRALNGLLSRA
jgi:hypothetical protein